MQSQVLYEGNKRLPSVDYLLRLLPLGADICFVLTGKRGLGATSDDEAILLDRFRAASEPLRRAALVVLQVQP